ncbi:type II secretion system F family protein [Urbifossiella limnaea]|uniref:Type II secretion system protein F n=1 Tax=Urbifossiella limnaea TaxID=2528023 RepID=A0A517Y020_9BACT|nr:type II secretion system F family protein [Urbifossiella limnaea]QDU23107.1 Type II secretion system protein F [Urbifossiella limnaea]
MSTVGRLGGGVLLFALLVGVPVALVGPGVVGVLLLLLLNGWALYAFFHHRHGQQDEFLAVLTATAEAGLPLAPAVDAYRADRRPRAFAPFFRWASFVGLPLYAYARIWAGWKPFDRLLDDLSARLDAGLPLSAALRETPGVAAREVRLAAAVGEAAGGLGAALRSADRERWSAAWLEVAPRVIYPLLVLALVSAITAFLMVFILPKFKKIFEEFGQTLPQFTRTLSEAWDALGDPETLVLVVLPVLAAAAAVVINPTLRWHAPLLGGLYRGGVQAEVLRTLGRLLVVGRTVPDALAFLAASDDLPGVARRRLRAAAADVNRGRPLDEALGAAGLLPPHMTALVRSAERVRNLPWALAELGDHLAGRAVRLVRRASLVVSPLLVVLVGAAVGFVALAMFLPLIQLITSLTE